MEQNELSDSTDHQAAEGTKAQNEVIMLTVGRRLASRAYTWSEECAKQRTTIDNETTRAFMIFSSTQPKHWPRQDSLALLQDFHNSEQVLEISECIVRQLPCHARCCFLQTHTIVRSDVTPQWQNTGDWSQQSYPTRNALEWKGEKVPISNAKIIYTQTRKTNTK